MTHAQSSWDDSEARSWIDERVAKAMRGTPRLSRSHLQRPRLVRVLDENWPVVVLHAPRGYGKTSTLIEWARSTAHPGMVWITLDEQMDRAQVWDRVRDTLVRHRLIDQRTAVHPHLVHPHLDPGNDTPAGRAMLLELIESSSAPIDLAIDAAHTTLPRALADDLVYLLQHNDRLRLRLATRAFTTFDDIATALTLDRRVIDLHELRFTLDETHQLASLASVRTSGEHIEKLHDLTNGWPFAIRAAIQLAPRQIVNARDPWFRDAPFGEGMRFVQKSLLEELMELPGFGYLLPTTVLETFTAEQAAALGADPGGAGVLNDVEARGLGTWEAEGAVARFRLQPLLREALLGGVPRVELLELHARLADWWDERDVALAFRAAINAEDWPRAARLARRDFVAVAASVDRDATLLAELPKKGLRSEPMLSFLAGLGHYRARDVPRAMRAFAFAVASGEQLRALRAEPTTVDQVWTQGLVTVALRLMGRWKLVPTALRSFQRMLGSVEDPDGELTNASNLILGQIATTHLLLGQLSDARSILQGLSGRRSIRPLSSAPRWRVHTDALTALSDSLDGELKRARQIIDAIEGLNIPGEVVGGLSTAPLHLAAAYSALEAFDGESAAAALNETKSHCASIEIWPLLAHARAQTEWMLAGPQAALTLLERIRTEKMTQPAISGAMSAMLDALTAELLLALGRSAESRALTGARRRRANPRLAIPAARDHLLTGEFALALGLTDSILRTADSARLRLEALVIAASAANRSGEPQIARARFRAAIDLAMSTGMRLPLAAMPRADFLTLAEVEVVTADLRAEVSAVTPGFPAPGEAVKITPREQIVLAELSTGATTPEIASRLIVSTNTVKAQIQSISRKLGASGRAQIVAEARRRGLL